MGRAGRPKPSLIGNARDAMGRPERETLSVGAGSGITAASGGAYATSIERRGDLIYTRIYIDLTGLNSSAAGDIIGVNSAANCHIGQVNAADSGTIVATTMECLETPAGGEPDIDLGQASVATGVEDAAFSALADDSLVIDAAADWTAVLAAKSSGVTVTDGYYLYLVGSGAGTSDTYTAGKLLITLVGR